MRSSAIADTAGQEIGQTIAPRFPALTARNHPDSSLDSLVGCGGCVQDNFGCLRALWALYDFEFDGIPFLQGTIAVADNGRVMNEYVRPIIPPDKTIAL